MKKSLGILVLIGFFLLCMRVAYELIPVSPVNLSDVRDGMRFFVVAISRNSDLKELSYETAILEKNQGTVSFSVPQKTDYFCVRKYDEGFCYRAKIVDREIQVDLRNDALEHYQYVVRNENVVPLARKIFDLKSVICGAIIALFFAVLLRYWYSHATRKTKQ